MISCIYLQNNRCPGSPANRPGKRGRLIRKSYSAMHGNRSRNRKTSFKYPSTGKTPLLSLTRKKLGRSAWTFCCFSGPMPSHPWAWHGLREAAFPAKKIAYKKTLWKMWVFFNLVGEEDSRIQGVKGSSDWNCLVRVTLTRVSFCTYSLIF